jgi:hypothetical protein
MKPAAALVLMLLASTASAYSYTGICFLDAILRGLDSISEKVNGIVSPTTTTTSTTSTSTTTTTEEPTTTTTDTTTTSTTTTSTTTTTFPGVCQKTEDCPPQEVLYTCDLDSHIIITTTNYVCLNPGPQSECKGRSASRIHTTCIDGSKCYKGVDHCLKPWEVGT